MKTVLSALLFSITAPVIACQTSDIAIEKLNGRVDGDYVYITGRLVNKCAQATGVQVKLTVYDKAGGILSVNDFWPASIDNIPARSDFPFQYMVRRQPGMAKYEARVISTNVWRARR